MEEKRDKYPRKEKKDVIFGLHPVLEAIKSEQELNKILIQKGIEKEHFRELKEILAGKDYNIQYVPIQKLNKLTSGNHQGIIAFVTPIEYQNIETLVDQWMEKDYALGGGLKPHNVEVTLEDCAVRGLIIRQ